MTNIEQGMSNVEGRAAACEEPVVIISDVHLRWGADWRGKYEGLRPIWRGAKTVVFNGDTVDWQLAKRQHGLAKVMAVLPEVCRSDGVRAVFIAGNADPNISPVRHLVLGGGRVLVTHGDVVFPEVSLWRPHPERIRRFREEALARLPEDQRRTLEGQLLAAGETITAIHAGGLRVRRGRWARRLRRMLTVLRRPAGMLAVMAAWWRAPSMAMEFMRRYAPRQRILVMGHTHRAGVWTKDGRTVINTGAFAKYGRPWMVWIDRGLLVVRRVIADKQIYSPGEVVGEFSLRD